MDDIDISVLRALHQWRANEQDALLITVIKTWGSSPRPVGAMMALRVGAEMVGSVSGGCIEDDLFERYATHAPAHPVSFVRYGINAHEAHRFGLPCGGTIELIIEHNPCAQQLKQIIAHLDDGRSVRRTVERASGVAAFELIQQHHPLHCDQQQLSHCLGPRWRMLLIGAGMLAKYLAAIAKSTGFAVTVCDPRSEHNHSWNDDDAQLVRSMPDDAVLAFKPDSSSCIVTLSHDPKMDDLAIIAGLNSEAFYVGCIGSRLNNETRRVRLREHFGFSAQSVNKLHGPIGLFIDSKTPAEIAVSIMAQIIAIKNGVCVPAEMHVAAAKNQTERLEATGHLATP